MQNLHASGKADDKLVRSGSQQTTEVPKEKSWVSSDCKPTLPEQCLEKLSEEVTFKLRCDRGQDSSECRVSREKRIVWDLWEREFTSPVNQPDMRILGSF